MDLTPNDAFGLGMLTGIALTCLWLLVALRADGWVGEVQEEDKWP